MEITVRDSRPEDLSFIFHANREMARETESRELDPLTLQRGVEAVLQDPAKGFYLLAEWDGAPAATLLVTAEWTDWRNGHFWWIQSVYVLPAHRGRGLYAALHREVLSRASKRDVRGIRLYVHRDNLPARKVYEKLGMSLSGYQLMEELLEPSRE